MQVCVNSWGRIVLLLVAVVGLAGPVEAVDPFDDHAHLVLAREFALDEPYTWEMRSDRPRVTRGWLVVVRADPELTVPRQGLGRILFVGEWAAEVLNTGRGSGAVVAIVPTPLDLMENPVFYAAAQVLPESMAPTEARALVAATSASPPDREVVDDARAAGGSPASLADRYQLRLEAANLIERFAPDEVDVVAGLRAPLVSDGRGLRAAGRDDPGFGHGTTEAGPPQPQSASKTTMIQGLTECELAGNTLAAYPFFEFVRAFNAGASVEVAVDPGRFSVAGETADIYVVESKSRAEWNADPTLLDVSSGGAERVAFIAGTIQSNTFTVDTGTLDADAGTGIGVGYDVVVDRDLDAMLGPGDLVDGYGDEAGLYAVHDLTQSGPLGVTEILYSGGVFLGQNTYYPADIASMGRLPLVVVSHGNGHSYLWYDHIGNHLASYGYVVMSHENNTAPGIESASTTTLTNTDYFLSNLDTIAGGVLENHIDSSRIVWIGHSRGGEGIVRAYDRIHDGAWSPAEYALSDLRLLSSIAPTSFLDFDDSHPHGVAYHVWVGGADSDVTGCAEWDGIQSFSLLDRAEGHRQSISLHGVGHGDFHDGGGSSWALGPCQVGRTSTHTLMRGYLLPLVKFFIEDNLPAEDFLWRQWERFRPIGAPTSSCVVVDLYHRPGDAVGKLVIDDFQSETSPAISSSGGAVTYSVSELTEGLLNDGNTTFTHSVADVMNGMTLGVSGDITRGLVFTFDSGGTQSIEFELVPGARDLTRFTYLSLRAAQATRHPLTVAELGDTTFTVTLEDGNMVESSINIGAYGGGLEEPYQRTGCGSGTGWNNEFETIRLRLTDFLNNGSGLDLSDVRSVVLRFGPAWGSAAGRIGLDQLDLLGSDGWVFGDDFEGGDTSKWSSVKP
jgi:hypothetical protein